MIKNLIAIVWVGSVLFSTNTFAEEEKLISLSEGKVLKSLTKYMLRDMHLQKSVKYFDIKQYYHHQATFKNGKETQGDGTIEDILDSKDYYKGGWSFDRASYRKLSSKEKKKILSLSPIVLGNDKFGYSYGKGYAYSNDEVNKYNYNTKRPWVSNLHYIDMQSKAHTIANKNKYRAFFGTIDTPAEIAMMLHSYKGKHRYKQVGDHYIIRTDNIVVEKNGGDGRCMHNVIQSSMTMHGELSQNYGLSGDKGPYDKKKCNALRRELGL